MYRVSSSLFSRGRGVKTSYGRVVINGESTEDRSV